MSHVGQTVLASPLFMRDMAHKNIVVRRFNIGRYVYTYYDFDFANEVTRLIAAKGLVSGQFTLDKLHEVINPSLMTLGEDEQNAISRTFYDTDELFRSFYRRFVSEVIAPLFGCTLYYQATPTFRFHFPHEKGFNWQPRYHTDIMLGHPPAEANVWLPITRAFATNSMRIANRCDSMNIIKACDFDFDQMAEYAQTDRFFQKLCHAVTAPVTLERNQLLIFDPRCLHATQLNQTDCTRISIDFRVMPVDEYDNLKAAYQGTGRRKMRFAPGEYYEENWV